MTNEEIKRRSELKSKSVEEYTNQDIIDFLIFKLSDGMEFVDGNTDKKIEHRVLFELRKIIAKKAKLEDLLLEKGILTKKELEHLRK